MNPQRTTSTGRCIATVALAASLALACGCAYFNTFHNAKAEFRRGEEDRAKAGSGDGGYQKCIEKCQSLLRYYPKSKYVDDALFLMGMSRFHRAEYVQARASLEDLIERFPQSEFVPRAHYWLGYAALRQGDTAAAAAAFEALAKQDPDNELNVEAVFRMAEARLDARDYDHARDDLRAFMEAHPKSALAAEAQLRLARTYHDEHRYAEARTEYERVLAQDVSAQVRYDAHLASALVLRAIAEEVLSDPALLPVVAADSAAGADSARVAVALTGAQETALRDARAQVDEVWSQLQSLRKAAAKLGRQIEHDIELAVTRALRGETEQAIDDLDQIARTRPKTAISARARYEIGEIHRRRGDLKSARTAYDDATREARGTVAVESAQKKSQAIVAREAASERLARAPEVLGKWHRLGGSLPALVDAPLESALHDSSAAPDTARSAAAADSARGGAADSLSSRLALAADFEALAAEQLRVAEIDLLDLDQPLVALREFERVLADYPGSFQAPRAAFAVAWIYDRRLRDAPRARDAYAIVAQTYPDSPQGRAAEAILAQWQDPAREVQDPFSRP
jgi:TolA-binding protein